MDRKILLIGQNRIGKNNFSILFEQCDLPDFEFMHFRTEHRAKNIVKNNPSCLVVIHSNRFEKSLDLIKFIKDINPWIPILMIMAVDRNKSNLLIGNGVHHVIHPNNLDCFSLTQNILSALEQTKVSNNLQARDKILQAVNYAAEVFLTQLNWDSRIKDVLAHLGAATRSDKVSIYENEIQVEIGFTPRLHASWSVNDSSLIEESPEPPSFDNSELFPPHWLNVLKRGKLVHGHVSDFSPEEQFNLMKRSIQSLAIIPIFSDKMWWGFISFEQCSFEKFWSKIELDALQTAVKILGAAISRLDAETRLTHLATHDYLTNLPNRMLLEDRFEQAVARADRSKKKFGIVTIDIDKFKNINDANGHPFGDKVLVEIAWRLSEAVRSSDTCARVGGDEFTVLAEGINNKKDLLRVMEKLTYALEPVINIDGKGVYVTASMGASIFPNHGTQLEQLMKAADIALYEVKDVYSGFKIFIDDQYSLLNE